MSDQRETPLPASAAAWFAIEKAKRGGGYASGGKIENFQRGWAMPVMCNASKAHHFVRYSEKDEWADAACGMWAPTRWLYGEGNFPRCKRCAAVLKREGVPP